MTGWNYQKEGKKRLLLHMKNCQTGMIKFMIISILQYCNYIIWPWLLSWFHTWLFVIWSNFCFTNILVSCLFLGQDSRGPYTPPGVVSDRRGWAGWPKMVPVIIICHLEQFLFSKHCSKWLFLEIAVKFSSQEHMHPPRIQEEKIGFDSRNPISGYDLI